MTVSPSAVFIRAGRIHSSRARQAIHANSKAFPNAIPLLNAYSRLEPVYTTREIYESSLRFFIISGYKKRVANLIVSVYDPIPTTDEQLELFASPTHTVSEAMDTINDRWGEFVITPALMMGMEDTTD